MPYSIEISAPALEELRSIKAYYRQQIIDAIDEQLAHEPAVETRSRKPLSEFEPDFDHESALWQMKVGEYRVFYDLNEQQQLVVVRAVRKKPPHKTTRDVT